MRLHGGLAFVTAEEMRVIDSEAINEYRIDVLSLMENAGVAVASLAISMLNGDVARKRVCCLVGKGNNGGDGLVAARHLSNRGAEVTVVLASRAEMGGVAARQLESVEAMGVPIHEGRPIPAGAALLIDALLGYNSKGDPREPVAGLISEANATGVPILAIDLPSGLDPTSGTPGDPCVIARATVTLGLPKMGFLNPASRPHVGDLHLGDVSIPRRLYERHSYPPPPFREGALLPVPLPL